MSDLMYDKGLVFKHARLLFPFFYRFRLCDLIV